MTASTQSMSASVAATATEAMTIPVAKILPWALLTAVIAVLIYYFVGAEQGASSLFSGNIIHEFVHDARHLLGFPCH